MNLFAYTAPGCDMPPYLSINRRDAGIEITVRSERKDGGHTACILLTEEQFKEMMQSLENQLFLFDFAALQRLRKAPAEPSDGCCRTGATEADEFHEV